MYLSTATREQLGVNEPLNRSTPFLRRTMRRHSAVRQTGCICAESAGCSARHVCVRAYTSLSPHVSVPASANRKIRIMETLRDTISMPENIISVHLRERYSACPISGAPCFTRDSDVGALFLIASDPRFGRRISVSGRSECSSGRKYAANFPNNRIGVTDNQFRSTP